MRVARKTAAAVVVVVGGFWLSYWLTGVALERYLRRLEDGMPPWGTTQ